MSEALQRNRHRLRAGSGQASHGFGRSSLKQIRAADIDLRDDGTRLVTFREAALEKLRALHAQWLAQPGLTRLRVTTAGQAQREDRRKPQHEKAHHSSPCRRMVTMLFLRSVGTPAMSRAIESRMMSH